MKRLSRFGIFLTVLALEILAIAGGIFSLAAKATYVEGHIFQHTTWTLVDSPIVLSNNVVVDPSVVLTIEPGVEVRFGGNFSIQVWGSIYAAGTQSRPVIFTSNEDKPSAGDWYSIQFSSTSQSTMANCKVTYATNAITVSNGKLILKDSEVSSNSQNGVTISNSEVVVENSIISNNVGAGIALTGINQTTIQSNTLRENSVGILLTGSMISNAAIKQNLMLLNTQSGIHLAGDAYSNLIILDNTISANNNGIYSSGSASTVITNNSVSHNTMGFFYEHGTGHVARFNDIYGNDYGIDVGADSTVDATYNYWGDETGPYHVSLNPGGKGDKVGGNGVSVDFIFFLTAPIGEINQPPTARLLTDLKTVKVGQVITFFGTTSDDPRPGHVDQYYFDFGDGSNSSWTTLSVADHAYISAGIYYATLTARDDFGVESPILARVRIDVQSLPSELDVSLSPSELVVGSEKQIPVIVQASNLVTGLPVEGVNITLISIVDGSFAPYSGLTDSAGHFSTVFSAPKVNGKTYVRIVATGSKAGYIDGSDHEYLEILPILDVEVSTSSATVKSEASSNVTALVTYNSYPVPNATVTLSSDSTGYFYPETPVTDSNGLATVSFTAPRVITQLNTTIKAKAQKTGYYFAENETTITVYPRTLEVEVIASPDSINSTTPSRILVKVTEDSKPIEGAIVTISSDTAGSFSSTTGDTNSTGTIEFDFMGAETTTSVEVTITASATKDWYLEGQGQTTLLLKATPGPEPISIFGLSMTTILLIVIPIAIVVIIIVLIKTKIIVISRDRQ